MIENVKHEDILFLDIETVPQYENLNDLPERFKELWGKKAAKIALENQSPDEI
jgi:hypothetical protein